MCSRTLLLGITSFLSQISLCLIILAWPVSDILTFFVDLVLIRQIAQKSGFAESYITSTEESTPTGFLSSALSTRAFGPTNEDYLWEMQRKVILELSEKEPCVIVGRCADFFLYWEGMPAAMPSLISIFLWQILVFHAML